MTKTIRKSCYWCEERPPRRLSHEREPIFCSRRCASTWALSHVGHDDGCEGTYGLRWCRRHRTWTTPATDNTEHCGCRY
jgi:hypothetical protein